MATDSIVFVHGAWHGGWCWERVLPHLDQLDAELLTPTLPGLEVGYSGLPPGLEEQVTALVDVIDSASGRVLLVAHSFGGMVATAAADRRVDRLSGLVYVDAAVPADGESFASQVPGIAPELVARREQAFQAMAAGGAWLPVPTWEVLGITKQEDKAWLGPRLVPHPVRTWLEPVSISAQRLAGVPRTYVVATDPPTDVMGYPLHAAVARASAGWMVRGIAAGHELMVHAPEQLASAVVEAATL